MAKAAKDTDVLLILPNAGADAVTGPISALHYANARRTPRETSFRLAYTQADKMHTGVYAVQGYNAAQMLGTGLAAVKGDTAKKTEFADALQKAKIGSLRGPFTI